MSTIFGSILHLLYCSDHEQQIWLAATALFMAALAVLHHIWRNNDKMLFVWRFLCAVPAATCAVHFYIYCFGTVIETTIMNYLPLYIIALLCAAWALFAKRKLGYRIGSAAVGFVTVVCGLYFCCLAMPYSNYTNAGYTGAFKGLISELKQHYVLSEWKEIDYDALEAEFLPQIEEAEKNGDAAAFAHAINRFSLEFNDGHISVDSPDIDFLAENYSDYGLASVRIDNGKIIAVCTGSEANKAGIFDGDVILEWNGIAVDKAISKLENPFMAPVAANEEFLKAMLVTSSGGETVNVKFLDKNGTEREATLNKLSNEPLTLMNAINLYERRDSAWDAYENGGNFSVKMVSEKCGYIYLAAEVTDSTVDDYIGYLTGFHEKAREMFRQKLDWLSAQGMEFLVIDLRGNWGGYDEIGCALTSLLTDEDAFGQGTGIFRDGEYVCVSEHNIKADGAYKDLEVIALTNLDCASAGDGTALYLSRLPNVTLAGITDPCGCNQETGGKCFLPEGIIFRFPTGLVIDENGVPNIDTRADRISRNPVEVHIPFDKEAAVQLFGGNCDYELEWAIRTLENAD